MKIVISVAVEELDYGPYELEVELSTAEDYNESAETRDVFFEAVMEWLDGKAGDQLLAHMKEKLK